MERNQLLNDPQEAMRVALQGMQSNLWTALPGVVTAVDYSDMTVTVQPTIQGQIQNENGSVVSVNLPTLVKVPIVYPSASNFLITMPMPAGTEVLVIFASRCLDAWWQSGGIQRPIEARMHDLSDGFAIPGPRSVPNKASSISSTGLQIRNKAGTAYVEIAADGKIKLVSPSSIEVTGNLNVDGNVVATGEVTGNSETVPVNLTAHVHPGVTSGGASTGGPVG